MTLSICPLSFRHACEVVDAMHRHHRRPQGHKFSLGAITASGDLVGVAIVGRPVARAFDDGVTVEVTRLATDGTRNACSLLYAAAWRTAKAAGYHRIITYTQEGESGASLRAVGWQAIAHRAPRTGWDAPGRPRQVLGTEFVARTLWEKTARATPLLRPPSRDVRGRHPGSDIH
ncbi:XF1762 family protein [Streptomyces noursei]|uniref:XF1762 family protein n=1 Tax=Streptomyces noursei TaxID=1971 RepID=UPI0009A06A18